MVGLGAEKDLMAHGRHRRGPVPSPKALNPKALKPEP